MNRAAVGIGSWLLLQRTPRLSLDITAQLLEQTSYMAWLEGERGADHAEEEQAFLAVLDEILCEALTPQEQQVLQGVFWEGKSISAVGRLLGIHHSVAGRCKERALEKIKTRLHYVMRYRALAASEKL